MFQKFFQRYIILFILNDLFGLIFRAHLCIHIFHVSIIYSFHMFFTSNFSRFYHIFKISYISLSAQWCLLTNFTNWTQKYVWLTKLHCENQWHHRRLKIYKGCQYYGHRIGGTVLFVLHEYLEKLVRAGLKQHDWDQNSPSTGYCPYPQSLGLCGSAHHKAALDSLDSVDLLQLALGRHPKGHPKGSMWCLYKGPSVPSLSAIACHLWHGFIALYLWDSDTMSPVACDRNHKWLKQIYFYSWPFKLYLCFFGKAAISVRMLFSKSQMSWLMLRRKLPFNVW